MVIAVNISGPKIGSKMYLPYIRFSPVKANKTNDPAISQCANLSMAANLKIVSPERPASTFILPLYI